MRSSATVAIPIFTEDRISFSPSCPPLEWKCLPTLEHNTISSAHFVKSEGCKRRFPATFERIHPSDPAILIQASQILLHPVGESQDDTDIEQVTRISDKIRCPTARGRRYLPGRACPRPAWIGLLGCKRLHRVAGDLVVCARPRTYRDNLRGYTGPGDRYSFRAGHGYPVAECGKSAPDQVVVRNHRSARCYRRPVPHNDRQGCSNLLRPVRRIAATSGHRCLGSALHHAPMVSCCCQCRLRSPGSVPHGQVSGDLSGSCRQFDTRQNPNLQFR